MRILRTILLGCILGVALGMAFVHIERYIDKKDTSY